MIIYLSINHKMDIIAIALIEKHIGIPFDVVRYLNEFVEYEKLTDDTIQIAVELWFDYKELCIFKYKHISLWNVSSVTDMDYLFCDRTMFNENISKWDVPNVVSMNFMFCYAESFNGDISKWNVSNVQSMYWMFHGAKSFDSDISKWNVSNVENTYGMFCNTQITIRHIINWNISQRLKNNAFM